MLEHVARLLVDDGAAGYAFSLKKRKKGRKIRLNKIY